MSLRSLLPIGRESSPRMLADADLVSTLHRDLDRFFDDMLTGLPLAGRSLWGDGKRSWTMMPRIDLHESEEGLDVSAELPGVEEKDVEIELTDDALILKGEKKAETDETDAAKGWHRVERSYGSFLRTVPLPFTVDADKVDATFAKGVLKVHLPRSAEARDKTRKIPVKAA